MEDGLEEPSFSSFLEQRQLDDDGNLPVELASYHGDLHDWDLDQESKQWRSDDEPGSEAGEAKDNVVSKFLQKALGKAKSDVPEFSAVLQPLPAIVEDRVMKRKASFNLPWERKPFCQIFGCAKDVELPAPMSEVGLKDTLITQQVYVPVQREVVPHFVAKRIRMSSLIASEDQLRWRALQKFRRLVLADPLCSDLGKSLLDVAGRLQDDKCISQTFEDAFAGKATSTLVRRSGSLQRYANWVVEQGLGNPLEFTEPLLYRYMGYLREKEAAPTVADSFLRAMVFTFHCCGLRHAPIDSLLSSRVKGASEAQFTSKRPLQQAVPLTVEMVAALEVRACGNPEEYETLVAGHLCLCLFASCRFSDATRITEVEVSTHAGVCLVETQTVHHKTATNKERKTTFLPLTALGIGITGRCWADGWVDARNFWLKDCRKGLAIPAKSEMTGRLLDRNLTSVEGVLYLKQILAEADVAEDDYKLVGTHSCKVTILSWCAMSARVSFADRRLIGHHVAPGQESVLTYSREESLRLMSIVYGILRLVMTGDLQPDLPRVHRLARLVQKEEAFGLDQTDVELGLAEEAGDDSDDCAEEDCAVQLEKLPPDMEEIQKALPISDTILLHVFSGVAHVKNGETKFFCGRPIGKNYERLPDKTDLAAVPICAQCSSASKSQR